jgi:hypothetical protein
VEDLGDHTCDRSPKADSNARATNGGRVLNVSLGNYRMGGLLGESHRDWKDDVGFLDKIASGRYGNWRRVLSIRLLALGGEVRMPLLPPMGAESCVCIIGNHAPHAPRIHCTSITRASVEEF